MASRSLGNSYRHKIRDVDVNDNVSDGKSFEYKTKIEVETAERLPQPANPGNTNWPSQPTVPPLNADVIIPLRYLSGFWRSLGLPLINCGVEPEFWWTKDVYW